MNKLSILALFITFATLALGVGASGRSTASGDTNEILQRSSARLHMLYISKAVWGSCTSDRYQGIDDAGKVNTKSSLMAEKTTHPDAEAWDGRPSVRFIGDIALVSGKEVETEQFPGGTVVSHYRRTEIWAKEHGSWMEQATQVTVLPRNYAKGMRNPPSPAHFSGRYEWDPATIETMRVSGSQLLSTFANSTEPLIFVGPNATTESDDLGVGTFYRNAGGKVAGYVYKRCDGQTIRIRKL